MTQPTFENITKALQAEEKQYLAGTNAGQKALQLLDAALREVEQQARETDQQALRIKMLEKLKLTHEESIHDWHKAQEKWVVERSQQACEIEKLRATETLLAGITLGEICDRLNMYAQRIAALEAVLKQMLDSAFPNEKEHPTMCAAWKIARAALGIGESK